MPHLFSGNLPDFRLVAAKKQMASTGVGLCLCADAEIAQPFMAYSSVHAGQHHASVDGA
jgi:hypothetical protein